MHFSKEIKPFDTINMLLFLGKKVIFHFSLCQYLYCLLKTSYPIADKDIFTIRQCMVNVVCSDMQELLKTHG